VPAVANEPSRVDEPLSEKANTSLNNASEIVRGKIFVEKNKDCPTHNEARDKIKSPDPAFEKEKNVAHAQLSSPEDSFVTEQSKARTRGLFQPTAKRANQRLKQASLRHMFVVGKMSTSVQNI
jgi:hypothetical protein